MSEYCQPLKLNLDVLVYLISFRNVALHKQGYALAARRRGPGRAPRALTRRDRARARAHSWYQVRLVLEGGQQQQPVVLSRQRAKSRFEGEDLQGLNCRVAELDGDGAERRPPGAAGGEEEDRAHAFDGTGSAGHAFYSNASRIRYTWETNALEHLVKYRLEVPITSAVRRAHEHAREAAPRARVRERPPAG